MNPSLINNPQFKTRENLMYNKLKNLSYYNSKISLVAPKNNRKSSAIKFYNENKSAIIFYRIENKSSEKENIKMAIFTEKSNDWKYIEDINCDGSDLNEIYLLKNKEKTKEFLIVGTTKDSKKLCTVYNLNGEDIKKIYSLPYEVMTVEDVYGDNINYLITITKTDELFFDPKFNLNIDERVKKNIESQQIKKDYDSYDKKFYPYSGKLTVLLNQIDNDEIKINYAKTYEFPYYMPDISIVNSTIDRKIFKIPSLILDVHSGMVDCYRTMLIIFDDKTYEKVEPIEKDISRMYKNMLTDFRYFPICIDIDKDQKLEYPISRFFPSFEDNKIHGYNIYKISPFLTYWYKFSGNIDEPFVKIMKKIITHDKKNPYNPYEYIQINYIKQTYADYTHRYAIDIPKKWNDPHKNIIYKNIAAKYINKNKDICFFIYDEKSKIKEYEEQYEEKLLTIKIDRIDNKEKHLKEGFFIIHTKGDIAYFANVHENIKLSNKSLKLTKEELKNIFFTI